LRNRPRGDKCSQQGNRLKLTVVRKIWAGHGSANRGRNFN
jgi:hypothetical protein